ASNGFIRERTPRQECEWCRVLGTGVNEFFRAISRIPHRRGSEAVRSRLAADPFPLGSYGLSRQLDFQPRSRKRFPVCPQPLGAPSLRHQPACVRPTIGLQYSAQSVPYFARTSAARESRLLPAPETTAPPQHHPARSPSQVLGQALPGLLAYDQ